MADKLERPASVFHKKSDDTTQVGLRMSTVMYEAVAKAAEAWDESVPVACYLIIDEFLQQAAERGLLKKPKDR